MTLKRYLMIMSLTTLVCWLAFGFVVFQVDPSASGVVGLLLFFASLFIALWGTLALLGFFTRFLFLKDTVPFRHIGISLRQALWFAILVVFSLFLVSQQIWVWWMSVLLVVGLANIEGFFLARSIEARKRRRKKRSNE